MEAVGYKLAELMFRSFLADYLITNGRPKCRSQTVTMMGSLRSTASVGLNNLGGPAFTFSVGMAWALAHGAMLLVVSARDPESAAELPVPLNDMRPLGNLDYSHFDREEMDRAFTLWYEKQGQENGSAFHHVYEAAAGFVFLHELAHFLSGHCHYFQSAGKRSVMADQHRDAAAPLSWASEDLLLAELQADVIACQLLSNQRVIGLAPDSSAAGRAFAAVGDRDWFVSLTSAMMLVFAVFEIADRFDTTHHTHPPAAMRVLNVIKHLMLAISRSGHFGPDNPANALAAIFDVFDKVAPLYQLLGIPAISQEEVYRFFGNSDLPHRSRASATELALLQASARDFRYKTRECAVLALAEYDVDPLLRTTMQAVALSGNHFPFSALGSEFFVEAAYRQIDFTSPRVLRQLAESDSPPWRSAGEQAQAKLAAAPPVKGDHLMLRQQVKTHIQLLLSLTEQELMARLGAEILQYQSQYASDYAAENDPATTSELYLQQFHELLARKVRDSRACPLLPAEPMATTEPTDDDILRCAIVADVIGGVAVISPVTTAALLVRKGLASFLQPQVTQTGTPSSGDPDTAV